MTVDSAYYLSLFLDEGREKLHQVGQMLTELEGDPHDPERIAQVFREIHSFKGNADTMGFEELTGLAHAMEYVLDGLRLRVLAAEPSHMRLLNRALLALEHSLAEVEAGGPEEVPAEILAELEAIAGHFELPRYVEYTPQVAPPVEGPAPGMSERSLTLRVEITLDAACFIKGTRAFMITTALEMEGAVLDITPSLEELDWPEASNTFNVLLLTDSDPVSIRAGLADIGEIASVEIHLHAPEPRLPVVTGPLAPSPAERERLVAALANGHAAFVATVQFVAACPMPGARAMLALQALMDLGEAIMMDPEPARMEGEGSPATFRVLIATARPASDLHEALNTVAEVFTVAVEVWEDVAVCERVVPQAAPQGTTQHLPGIAAFPDPTATEGEPDGATGPRRVRTMRIAADRYDELLAMAERMSEANARVARLAQLRDHGTGPLADAANMAAELAQSLAIELARLRRMPIEAVFNRFPRMVRELAHELGKQVSLQVLGSELEVERALADELSDLLVHLLRNAVDHGLEGPAERHEAGKGAVGTLQLAARREAGYLIITVADDGRGIEPKKLATAAVTRGHLSAAEAERLDDESLLQLIFDAGFTTAQATTRISGRGVGLDAVKCKAEALGGRLTVESAVGRGSIFQLRFPVRADQAPRTDERVGA